MPLLSPFVISLYHPASLARLRPLRVKPATAGVAADRLNWLGREPSRPPISEVRAAALLRVLIFNAKVISRPATPTCNPSANSGCGHGVPPRRMRAQPSRRKSYDGQRNPSARLYQGECPVHDSCRRERGRRYVGYVELSRLQCRRLSRQNIKLY